MQWKHTNWKQCTTSCCLLRREMLPPGCTQNRRAPAHHPPQRQPSRATEAHPKAAHRVLHDGLEQAGATQRVCERQVAARRLGRVVKLLGPLAGARRGWCRHAGWRLAKGGGVPCDRGRRRAHALRKHPTLPTSVVHTQLRTQAKPSWPCPHRHASSRQCAPSCMPRPPRVHQETGSR